MQPEAFGVGVGGGGGQFDRKDMPGMLATHTHTHTHTHTTTPNNPFARSAYIGAIDVSNGGHAAMSHGASSRAVAHHMHAHTPLHTSNDVVGAMRHWPLPVPHFPFRAAPPHMHAHTHMSNGGDAAICHLPPAAAHIHLPASSRTVPPHVHMHINTPHLQEAAGQMTLGGGAHTAAHCNTLQHAAVHLSHGGMNGIGPSLLGHPGSAAQHTAAHSNTLQHTAPHLGHHLGNGSEQSGDAGGAVTHCNALQHAATHCNTQQSGGGGVLR